MSCLNSDVYEAFLKASSEAKYSFWIKSRTGTIFHRTKRSRILEGGCDSTWRLVEDISIALTQKVSTLTVFALVLNAISVRQLFLITSKRQVAMIMSILYLMQ